MKNIPNIDYDRINTLIQLALSEDLSDIGDTTSLSVIPQNITTTATFKCKEDCVCAGLMVAEKVFLAVNKNITFKAKVNDGDFCKKGTILAEIKGDAISLLTAERTALNFIQRLCGIATVAKKYSDAIEPNSKTVVLDTRKTTPGWRNIEKYAVAVGGAVNHRIGLYDRIMIKDNHRELAGLEGEGGIIRSVERAKEMYPKLEVEVEADALDEVKMALEAGAEYILLDNMTNDEMIKAVELAKDKKSKLEASGGITLEKINSISKIGVDFISVGALTHSVKATDISMEMDIKL